MRGRPNAAQRNQVAGIQPRATNGATIAFATPPISVKTVLAPAEFGKHKFFRNRLWPPLARGVTWSPARPNVVRISVIECLSLRSIETVLLQHGSRTPAPTETSSSACRTSDVALLRQHPRRKVDDRATTSATSGEISGIHQPIPAAYSDNNLRLAAVTHWAFNAYLPSPKGRAE